MTRTKILTVLIFAVAVAVTSFGYYGRIEHSRQADPSGRFFAVVSHRPHHHLPLPIYRWGTHSDTPAFVEILDKIGNSYGEIPVPLTQSAEVRWDGMTAMIPAIAEWDFSAGTCYYWNEKQDTKIFTKE